MQAAVAVYRWAYGALSGDAALAGIVTGVYADLAPEGAQPPYLVVTLEDASDVRALGKSLALNVSLAVRVVTGSDLGPAEQALERVDEVLPQATGPYGDVTVAACWRERQAYFVEVDQGSVYRHAIAYYRVLVT